MAFHICAVRIRDHLLYKLQRCRSNILLAVPGQLDYFLETFCKITGFGYCLNLGDDSSAPGQKRWVKNENDAGAILGSWSYPCCRVWNFFLKKPGLEFFFQKTGFGICAVRLCDKDKLKGNKTKTELPVIAAHPRAHSRVLKTFRDRSIYAISLLDTRISLKNICESW